MPPNPSFPRQMMYRPVPSPIKPCQTSSRRAAGEAPVSWTSKTTSSTDTKWRTWKSLHQDEDPACNSNGNNIDDGYCKSTPTISTTVDIPLSHDPRTPTPKKLSITDGTSPKCVLLRDTTSPHLSSVSIVANRQDDPQVHQQQQQQQEQQSSSPPSPLQLEFPALTASGKARTEKRTIATTFRNDQIGAHHSPSMETNDDVHVTTRTPTFSDASRTVDSTHDDQGSASLQHNNNSNNNKINPVTVPLRNNNHDDDDDDDVDLDDIEKERRRQARALEQQQRILSQVDALRQLKRNKDQKKHHHKAHPAAPHVLTREVASHPPSTGIPNHPSPSSKGAAPSDNKSRIRSSHDHADDHRHDHDAKRAAMQAHRRERPPRTKGLLYQRQANGSLVLIDRAIDRQPHLN